jgi:hypothetical protein
MKPIQIENILKVLDIPSGDVDQGLIDWLEEHHAPYLDTHHLAEHLCDAPNAFDEYEEDQNELTDLQLEQLEQLHKLCADNDAGYVRFID